MLAEFLKRLEKVNGRDELAYYVHEAYIFRSYLNKRAKDVGDLDIAIDLRFREMPGRDLVDYSTARGKALDHPALIRRMIVMGTGPRGGEGMTFTELSLEELADPVALLMGAFFTRARPARPPGEPMWNA